MYAKSRPKSLGRSSNIYLVLNKKKELKNNSECECESCLGMADDISDLFNDSGDLSDLEVMEILSPDKKEDDGKYVIVGNERVVCPFLREIERPEKPSCLKMPEKWN